MNKKRWALVIFIPILIFGYVKLFYTKIDATAVPKSVDMVFALDVKRVARTMLWSFIKHPSKWSISSNKDTSSNVKLKDALELPDYILAYHRKNEPIKNWYCLLKIKDAAVFKNGLRQIGFESNNGQEYTSNILGMSLYVYGGNVLVSNYIDDFSSISIAAGELFVKKEFISEEKLNKISFAKSHGTLFIAANNFLQEDGMIRVNFSEDDLKIEGTFLPKTVFAFSENNFSYSNEALLSLGFTQPSKNVYALLKENDKVNISKAIGVNLDSLLLPSNKYYQLDLQAIKPKIDSAITYTFDDDFNKVEKMVVNKVDEPAFSFLVKGDSVQNIYNNWSASKALLISDTGALFRPMPFVKSYCSLSGKNEMTTAPKNYSPIKTDKNLSCILFVHMLFGKMPATYVRYLPTDIGNLVEKLETMDLKAQKNGERLEIKLDFKKMKAAKSLIYFNI